MGMKLSLIFVLLRLLGGQCLLAVVVPGPNPQAGSSRQILPATVETATSDTS